MHLGQARLVRTGLSQPGEEQVVAMVSVQKSAFGGFVVGQCCFSHRAAVPRAARANNATSPAFIHSLAPTASLTMSRMHF
jgi:acyl-CoA thioesterase